MPSRNLYPARRAASECRIDIVARRIAYILIFTFMREAPVAPGNIAADVHHADGSAVAHIRWAWRLEANIEIGSDAEICEKENYKRAECEPKPLHISLV